MSGEQFSYTQLFQQAIAVTITCRTIIKYNSTLSAEQKEEILAEIESTLAFLEKSLEANATLGSSSSLSLEKRADLAIIDADKQEMLAERIPTGEGGPPEISWQNLYRLYRYYLSNEPGLGIAALETRYKAAIDVLDQLQEFAVLRQEGASSDQTIEGQVHRVRAFISAIYFMFREFAAQFSKLIEGEDIDTDTEALTRLQKSPLADTQPPLAYDIAPLMRVYDKHIQLQEHKGKLAARVNDTTAFLIFLEETLGPAIARRKDIAAQLQLAASLLNELTDLLANYEQAVETIIQSPSASQ